MLKRLAGTKHSSLLGLLVSYSDPAPVSLTLACSPPLFPLPSLGMIVRNAESIANYTLALQTCCRRLLAEWSDAKCL